MKTVHTFDPNGDLVFLLPEVSEAKPVEEETNGTLSSRNKSSNGAVTPSEASDDGQSEMHLEPPLDIHMLVSSRHMMLASRVFSAMLQHSNFQEGQTLASTGRVDIPLPEDDPESFIILLNIIHGRSRKVPRTVDLELLTKLAISVDKYELHEVVEVYSYSWIDTLPKTYTEENALLWLAISWVFDLKEEFRAVTKVIERSASSDLMDILGNISPHLPIPGRIIEAILTRRQQVLFCLFNTIELQAKVYQGSVLCDRKDGKEDRKSACDAMVLGSLLKGAMESGLWPIQPPPYAGFNVNNVMSAVRCLTIVALCDEIDRWYEAKTAPSSYSNRYSYGTPTHVQTHGVKQAIEEHVDSLEERLCGFDIDDFKAEKKVLVFGS